MQKHLNNKQIPQQSLVQLGEFGLLKISGQDAIKLLQGQLTCNVETLRPNEAQIAAHCNPQGRIISLFYISFYQDAFYLLMPRALIPIQIKALKRYAVFYKVALHDMSDELMLIGYTGPSLKNISDNLLLFNFSLPFINQIVAGEYQTMMTLWQELAKQNTVISDTTWKRFHLINGFCFIYPETSEKFLPHDIHLHQLGGIDFNKGCYTGQEIIARMHYRGKLKNHLYLTTIQSEQVPKRGADIYSLTDQTIKITGTVVDTNFNETNHHDALIITDEINAKKDHLFLHRDQGYFNIQDL